MCGSTTAGVTAREGGEGGGVEVSDEEEGEAQGGGEGENEEGEGGEGVVVRMLSPASSQAQERRSMPWRRIARCCRRC